MSCHVMLIKPFLHIQYMGVLDDAASGAADCEDRLDWSAAVEHLYAKG
jgi:hypothetical protein